MRSMACLGYALACTTGGAVLPATAFESLSGTFVADSACIATVRIRDDAGVAVEPGASYRLLGANRVDATHYQVRLQEGGDRWVPVGCGRVAGGDGGTGGHGGSAPEYVLAVSWQPAFCEGHADKPECASQTDDRFDATHFTLHGLWPQPRSAVYCGVGAADQNRDRPGSWHLLPAVELDPATRAGLDEAMPGTQSALERHEWIKHGTCYGSTQEDYFQASLDLLRQLNDSAVRTVVAGRIDGEITHAQLVEAFDASFGMGSGERVAMDCARDGRRDLMAELQLHLAGEITADSRLDELLAAAAAVPADCPIGLIDPVGLND